MDGWIIFVLGLVLGIPLSIFANIATPWVISYFKNRSLSSRQITVIDTVILYERVVSYRENPTILIIWMIHGLMVSLICVGLLVVLTFFDLNDFFVPPIIVFLLIFMLLPVGRAERVIEDANRFEKYREGVISKLSKLGYTLEEAQELKNKQTTVK